MKIFYQKFFAVQQSKVSRNFNISVIIYPVLQLSW